MTAETTYRLDPRHVLRLFGTRLVVAALCIVVGVVCLLFSNEAVQIVGYVTSAGGAVLTVVAIATLIRPPVVVTLTEAGYRVRRVPDCGVKSASWVDVTRVDDKTGSLGPTLVIALGSGSTTLPLVLVANRSLALQREVRERLNHAHGYRRFV